MWLSSSNSQDSSADSGICWAGFVSYSESAPAVGGAADATAAPPYDTSDASEDPVDALSAPPAQVDKLIPLAFKHFCQEHITVLVPGQYHTKINIYAEKESEISEETI